MSRQYSAHIGYLFTDLPLDQRFAAAKKAGFAAVEHSDLYATDQAEVRRLLDAESLAFAWVNLPSGDLAKGERGFACRPQDAARFSESLEHGLDYAATIGCRLVHPMSGIRPEGVSETALLDLYLENLSRTADAAAARGLDVVIEPLGDAAIANYFMNSTVLAVRAIQESGRRNVGVLLDIYHTINCGEDPFSFVATHGSLVRHVHLADYPGRHEPGTGGVDFARLFDMLDAQGYTGYYGCEYVPAMSTTAGLGWMGMHQ